jgi:hypothetical protein
LGSLKTLAQRSRLKRRDNTVAEDLPPLRRSRARVTDHKPLDETLNGFVSTRKYPISPWADTHRATAFLHTGLDPDFAVLRHAQQDMGDHPDAFQSAGASGELDLLAVDNF